VRVAPGVGVRADPDRLEQIMVNLATNQLRYGHPPYVVEAQRDDGEVVVSFRDQGPGVPEAKQDALFEPFGTRSDAGSVGLGLSIVRALVGAHGGRVSYRRNEPAGSCFEVVLPASS